MSEAESGQNVMPLKLHSIVTFCHSGTPLRFLCFWISGFLIKMETWLKVDAMVIGEISLYEKSYTELLSFCFYI